MKTFVYDVETKERGTFRMYLPSISKASAEQTIRKGRRIRELRFIAMLPEQAMNEIVNPQRR